MWLWLLLRAWFSQITAVVWLVLAFISFVIEVSIPHFGFAFVGAGALVAAAAAFFGFSIPVQLGAFIVVVLASLVLLRSAMLTRLGGKGVPSRTESLIGRNGVVTDRHRSADRRRARECRRRGLGRAQCGRARGRHEDPRHRCGWHRAWR